MLVIALLALVVAVSGSAVAATHLVKGDRLIKKHSLSGNRLKKHTITATQVDLGRLGTVPSATNAGSAVTATTAGNGAIRINFQPTAATDPAPVGGPLAPGAHPLVTLGQLTISASCVNAGGTVRVYLAFGAPSGELNWGGVQFNNPGTVIVSDGTVFTPAVRAFAVADLTGNNHSSLLNVVYNDGSRTVTATLSIGSQSSGPGCQIFGTVLTAS